MPDLNLDSLVPLERDLYLCGQQYDYWQVQRKHYNTDTDFNCAEKQRSRQKKQYIDMVRRYWPYEPLAKLEQRISQQLNEYGELMHTRLYQALLDICHNRWYAIEDYPSRNRLPNRLKLPSLSEIYPLYTGRFPTMSKLQPTERLSSDSNVGNCLRKKPQLLLEFDFSCPSNGPKKTDKAQLSKVQSNGSSKALANELSRLKKLINAPSGLHFSIPEASAMLSAKTYIALAHSGQSLMDLKHSVTHRAPTPKVTLPLLLLSL